MKKYLGGSYDSQHKGLVCDTQHKWEQSNSVSSTVMLSVASWCHAECHTPLVSTTITMILAVCIISASSQRFVSSHHHWRTPAGQQVQRSQAAVFKSWNSHPRSCLAGERNLRRTTPEGKLKCPNLVFTQDRNLAVNLRSIFKIDHFRIVCNRTARIRHPCRKTIDFSCHRYLTLELKKMNNI